MYRRRHRNPEHSADENQDEGNYVSDKGCRHCRAKNRRVHSARYQRAEKHAYCADNPETYRPVRGHKIVN